MNGYFDIQDDSSRVWFTNNTTNAHADLVFRNYYYQSVRDYDFVIEGNNFKGTGWEKIECNGGSATNGKYLFKDNVLDSAGVSFSIWN